MLDNKPDLRINCTFSPGKNTEWIRRFLERDRLNLYYFIREQLGLGGTAPCFLTHVIGGADQRYSIGVQELNLDLLAYPSVPGVQVGTGADQLYYNLCCRFEGLSRVGVQITYLSGFWHPSWNQICRVPDSA